MRLTSKASVWILLVGFSSEQLTVVLRDHSAVFRRGLQPTEWAVRGGTYFRGLPETGQTTKHSRQDAKGAKTQRITTDSFLELPKQATQHAILPARFAREVS